MTEAEILELLEDARTALNANKPVSDGKRARAYAITITQLELVIAQFQVYAMGAKNA